MMRVMRLFLKDQLALLGWYGVVCVVMVLTFFLYDLDLTPFWDGLLFTSALLVVYLIWQFNRWYPKYRRLVDVKEVGLPSNASNFLPEPKTTNEGLTQAILIKTLQENQAIKEDNQQKQQALLADFGLWLHQVKTPVAAMDLLVQAGDLDQRAFKNELFKVNEYLQLILNYLRNSMDSNDFVFKQIAVDKVVKETVKKYATFFSQKELELVLQLINQKVTTDEKWLQFMLEQVLFNSVKYTEKGQIAIAFADNYLQVKDSGRGIRPEDLPRIFEKGYTGYNGRTEQRASGLGLYLTKEVADKIGIQLAIESTLGEGTTVTFKFPG